METLRVNGATMEVPSRAEVLETINVGRAALGREPLTELPRAVPMDACGCVFGVGLGVSVRYASTVPGEEWWEWVGEVTLALPETVGNAAAEVLAAALGGEYDSDRWRVVVPGGTPAMRWMLAFDHKMFKDLIDDAAAVG